MPRARPSDPPRPRATPSQTPRASTLPPIPLTHPAPWIVALVATGFVLAAVGYQLNDPDLWQHLRVGKAIWDSHAIPMTQVWCWPTYGEPQVLPSWGFRALLWPFWQLGGVTGLFVWRWLTTLAAFALLWAAARRMGARGLTPLVVIVLASLTYRQRSLLRPEMLIATLLACELWVLEVRRTGGPDRSAWLVPLVWLWSAAHISFVFAFIALGAYAAHEWI